MIEKRFVEVVTYTWSKDSHGLFDYESPHLFTNSFKITSAAHFSRKNNDIQLLDTSTITTSSDAEPSFNSLFSISQDPANPGRYFISAKNSNNTSHSQNIDLVVRAIRKDGRPAGYELKVGDIVKIGRVKFWVREMKDANGAVTKLRTLHEVNFITSRPEDESERDPSVPEVNCRICLMNNLYPDPLDNTLVSPCKCKGSCEYVHLKCLKQWIDSKKSAIENSENVCLSFNYTKLSCEICKENLPYALKLGPDEYDIIDIKKPATAPYIILEKVENGRENKGLFLVKASEHEVRLGRGHTHQILVSDISVSRNHASIVYKDGQFLLFDNNSKFGTLVQIDQPIELSSEKTILQCGKTVIMLSIKKEDCIVMPKTVPMVEEIAESPETPSTINEQDQESKLQTGVGARKDRKKKDKRDRDNERRAFGLNDEESKQSDSLDELGLIESEAGMESKIMLNSKKIFKIIREDSNTEGSVATRVGGEKKRKGKRNN